MAKPNRQGVILAVEPDQHQAQVLARVIKQRVKADFVVVDSRDAAIAALSARVPVVILLTALLSPRDEDEMVAHLAVLEKWIGTERGDLKIGGVAEVCVATAYRRHRQAARLIRAAHDWMRGNGFEFAMLFGQPGIYQSSGYALIENEIAATNSLARHWNPFCGKPMIHRLSDKPWPEGRIDLRGPTF